MIHDQGLVDRLSVLPVERFERDGALAEVVSYLVQLTPLPSARPLKVSRLAVSTSRTLRLVRTSLVDLGIDPEQYGARDYARTQQIGAALAFLELDGLIAPSARWPCDNLMIFTANHALTHKIPQNIYYVTSLQSIVDIQRKKVSRAFDQIR